MSHSRLRIKLPDLRRITSYNVCYTKLLRDWQEAPTSNTRRTTARDGWARVPLGADAASDFPLRRFLLGRSHLVLALRLLFDPPPSNRLAPTLATRFVADAPALLVPDPPHLTRLRNNFV